MGRGMGFEALLGAAPPARNLKVVVFGPRVGTWFMRRYVGSRPLIGDCDATFPDRCSRLGARIPGWILGSSMPTLEDYVTVTAIGVRRRSAELTELHDQGSSQTRPAAHHHSGARACADSVWFVLEIWHPDEQAFWRLEEYLHDRGFFRRSEQHQVADIFLGYGLSGVLRRTGAPDPPEPCPLPLLACCVRGVHQDVPDGGEFSIGEWRSGWSEGEYAAAVEGVRAAIACGDVYQVNLVRHLSAPFEGDPAALVPMLAGLAPIHPRPLFGDGWAIVSASPEVFLGRRGSRVWTKPIKGTRPSGVEGELHESQKDRAEHVMIVDLERNDLARVCLPGSIRWPTVMAEEQLAGVTHLVTTVEGILRPSTSLAELLHAVFPGGSVTGAPKIAAIDHIAALEPVGRGASMGALGTIYGNGDLDLALTIRTFAVVPGEIHLWVGGGIVSDSDPDDEIEESWVKARPLLAAVGAPFAESVTA